MKHRRRILLINRSFQLKFSFFVCSWVMVLALVLPSVMYSAIEAFMRILSRKVDEPTLKVIQNFQSEMIIATVIFMLIFGVTIFLIALFLSHRIAGPVYRIQSALERFARGTVEKDVKLRKFDHFRELCHAYNGAAEQFYKIKEQTHLAAEKLQKISEELEPKHRAQLQELVGELQCITQKK